MPEPIRVLIQMREFPKQSYSATFDMGSPTSTFSFKVPGFSLDKSYKEVLLPGRSRKTTGLFAFETQAETSTYVVRGQVENEAVLESLIKDLESNPNAVGVFSDPRISLFVCPPAKTCVGDCHQVEQLLRVSELHSRAMNGSNVRVAIVDSGINLTYLQKRGKTPNFDAGNSWTPNGNVEPGSAPVGHGTMCAFDACIAAPNCTLLDYPVILPTDEDPPIKAWLSDVIPIYDKLRKLLESSGEPKPALVINNSWGMYHPDWDYPVGNLSHYSDNPEHPFNLLVETLEEAGADILFAAGNCGAESPHDKCRGVSESTIYGANSHPKVLSIAAVTVNNERLGYSSRGPGRLEDRKPDLSAYSHFEGSGICSMPDSGTSAACAVAAGVVAAIRSVYSPSVLSPAQLRQILRQTAENLSPEPFDYSYGFGLIDVPAILATLAGMNINQQSPENHDLSNEINAFMTQEEFKQIVSQEAPVLKTLRGVALTADVSPTMDFGVTEIIFLSIVLPMTSYIVKEIGLPWLHEAQRYSELWRFRLDRWIDEQYQNQQIDINQARIAGEELRRQLEETTDPEIRAAWERVYNRLLPPASDEE